MRPVDDAAGFRVTTKQITLFGVLVASFAILYKDVIVKLIRDWSIDETYSHGYLVVPVALYFAWDRRERLLHLSRMSNWLGLPVVLASIGLLLGEAWRGSFHDGNLDARCYCRSCALSRWLELSQSPALSNNVSHGYDPFAGNRL